MSEKYSTISETSHGSDEFPQPLKRDIDFISHFLRHLNEDDFDFDFFMKEVKESDNGPFYFINLIEHISHIRQNQRGKERLTKLSSLIFSSFPNDEFALKKLYLQIHASMTKLPLHHIL